MYRWFSRLNEIFGIPSFGSTKLIVLLMRIIIKQQLVAKPPFRKLERNRKNRDAIELASLRNEGRFVRDEHLEELALAGIDRIVLLYFTFYTIVLTSYTGRLPYDSTSNV